MSVTGSVAFSRCFVFRGHTACPSANETGSACAGAATKGAATIADVKHNLSRLIIGLLLRAAAYCAVLVTARAVLPGYPVGIFPSAPFMRSATYTPEHRGGVPRHRAFRLHEHVGTLPI